MQLRSERIRASAAPHAHAHRREAVPMQPPRLQLRVLSADTPQGARAEAHGGETVSCLSQIFSSLLFSSLLCTTLFSTAWFPPVLTWCLSSLLPECTSIRCTAPHRTAWLSKYRCCLLCCVQIPMLGRGVHLHCSTLLAHHTPCQDKAWRVGSCLPPRENRTILGRQRRRRRRRRGRGSTASSSTTATILSTGGR